MTDLSKTLFIPLYFKYKESLGTKRIYDLEAVNFFEKSTINIEDFSEIDKDTLSFQRIISRTLIIDSMVKEALQDNAIDFIANLGCGLDFRNRRLDISIPWYNIDLPSVIDYREKAFSKISNEYNINGDILTQDFMNTFPNGKGIFIFEGLLMFFSQEEVIKILANIQNEFKSGFFIIHTFPEQATIIPSINSISNNQVLIKWRSNNPKFLEEKINIRHIKGSNLIKLQNENDFMINLYQW